MPYSELFKKAMHTGVYECQQCGKTMEFTNFFKDYLYCPACGFEISLEMYGFTEDEYEEKMFGYCDQHRNYSEYYDDEDDEISF